MLKRTLIVFSVLCLTAAANLRAEAGDYYTYRDAKGNLVISNSAPPPAAKVIAKQTLGEVTDQEIAEARAREQDAALQNRLSSFEATDEQQSNSRPPTSAAEYAQPDTGGGSVVVGVSNESVRRPPHRLATNP